MLGPLQAMEMLVKSRKYMRPGLRVLETQQLSTFDVQELNSCHITLVTSFLGRRRLAKSGWIACWRAATRFPVWVPGIGKWMQMKYSWISNNSNVFQRISTFRAVWGDVSKEAGMEEPERLYEPLWFDQRCAKSELGAAACSPGWRRHNCNFRLEAVTEFKRL